MRRTKSFRFVSILIFAMLFSLGPTSHSQAIFGLSKCERVKKKIQSEELVGRELWNRLDKKRAEVVSKAPSLHNRPVKPLTSTTVKYVLGRDASIFYQLLNELYESDLRAYKLAQSEKKCFSSKVLADIRIFQSQIKRDLPIIKSNILDFNRAQSLLYWTGEYEYIVSVYKKYYSIYNLK